MLDKKRLKFIFTGLVLVGVIVVGALFVIGQTSIVEEIVQYDEMTIKKIAWDSIPIEEQKIIVPTTENLYSKETNKEGIVVFSLNDELVEIENVWKYAIIEETNFKSIKRGLWYDDTFSEETRENMKSNDIVLVVSFENSNMMLGALHVYVDYKTSEVLGFGMRM